MKLYQYDHCPFCVRADMVANYRQVRHEKVYLLNDDEQTCLTLIGTKMVPILQFDDGSAMGESLDIVRELDRLGPPERPLMPGTEQPAAILAAFEAAHLAISCLLFPRNIALDLPEFATTAARDYFRHKKEARIGRSFEQALQETARHQACVEQMLSSLPALPATMEGRLGLDDVLVYPTLRNLSMVRDLQMPGSIQAYLERIAALTGTHTYFDRAL